MTLILTILSRTNLRSMVNLKMLERMIYWRWMYNTKQLATRELDLETKTKIKVFQTIHSYNTVVAVCPFIRHLPGQPTIKEVHPEYRPIEHQHKL